MNMSESICFNNFTFSPSSSQRLKKKNIFHIYREEVEGETHHISALFFDIKRFLKQDEYAFLLKKLSPEQHEIIDFVAVNADEMNPKDLLNGLGRFPEADLAHVYKTLDYEFDSSAFFAVECLFELAIQYKKASTS